MSSRDPSDPRDSTPDTHPSPVHRPRESSQGRNVLDPSRAADQLEGEEPKKGQGWTMEARVALAALLLTVLLSAAGGAVWVGGIARDVTDLQAWKAAHVADSESRIRSLEFTQHDSAGDMKVVLERLNTIDSKLSGITAAVVVQPNRQPRNRPTPARPRVDNH